MRTKSDAVRRRDGMAGTARGERSDATETGDGIRRVGETLQPMPDGKEKRRRFGVLSERGNDEGFRRYARTRRIVGALFFFASRPSIRVVVVVSRTHRIFVPILSRMSRAAIVFSELAAPLHKPVGPHQTSNGFHVIMVHDRHLANAEMREQARIATEEAKKKREESLDRNMKKEQAKQERKGARAQARQERKSTHDEF